MTHGDSLRYIHLRYVQFGQVRSSQQLTQVVVVLPLLRALARHDADEEHD